MQLPNVGDPRRIYIFDPTEMQERLQLEESLVHEAARVFLDDLPRRRRTLIEAWQDANEQASSPMVHALKGTASNLAAQGVVEACRAYEAAVGTALRERIVAARVSLLEQLELLELALEEFGRPQKSPRPTED